MSTPTDMASAGTILAPPGFATIRIQTGPIFFPRSNGNCLRSLCNMSTQPMPSSITRRTADRSDDTRRSAIRRQLLAFR